ncbi:MAG: hypothetical protein U5K69_08560 [Balneolaceae bacterium]|nr:hypothetical protein [Balneolaceae bacterium]
MGVRSSFLKYLVFILLVSLLITGFINDGSGSDADDRKSDQAISYTSKDATLAFESFNEHFYSPELNLYYRTTEREKLGSIWTQAIFWDVVNGRLTSEPGIRTMNR